MKRVYKNIHPEIYKIYLLLVGACACIFSCNKIHDKHEIESAMMQYDHFIQKVDADSISLMYAADGDLGEMAHGRDSIRKFLMTFKNVKVLLQSSVSDSIQLNGDSATQYGSYKQVAVTNEKDTARLKGTYIARWKWVPDEGWRMKRMDTKPAN